MKESASRNGDYNIQEPDMKQYIKWLRRVDLDPITMKESASQKFKLLDRGREDV